MEAIKRKNTRQIKAGTLLIGGNAPISIQSMTNTQTSDLKLTLDQIFKLKEAGCELVRVAVPDLQAAYALKEIVSKSPMPVAADIHFDLELALLALEAGVAKIRINPGNLGGKEKLLLLAKKAEALKVPLRVGVNAGSLERSILKKHGGPTAAAMADSAFSYIAALEREGFFQIVLSLKASDVMTTIRAYRLVSEKCNYPLHLGVTEAGPQKSGTVKSAIGIGALLADGIGDTIRVSLTAAPEEEIKVARLILQSLNLRHFGPDLISCPTCGRCQVKLEPLVAAVEKLIEHERRPIKIAVMGCAVNGPGEAKEADLGICAGKKQGLLFKKGIAVRTVSQDQLLKALQEELIKF